MNNKKTIHVRVNKGGKLSQAEFDKIMREWWINLTSRKTTAYKIYWLSFLSVATFIWLCIQAISYSNTLDANYLPNNDTFEIELQAILDKEEQSDDDVDKIFEMIIWWAIESIDTDLIPTQEWDKKMREEFDKNEIKESVIPKKAEKLEFDINRLAFAVAMAETWNCTKWYWKEYNNCFWIKSWNTAPCEKIWRNRMCIYEKPEDSYEAFKIIRQKWYWEFPTYEMAKRYSWNDRVDTWLRNTTHWYRIWPEQ